MGRPKTQVRWSLVGDLDYPGAYPLAVMEPHMAQMRAVPPKELAHREK